MKKDPDVFLGHILECIDLIESYSEGVTETEFLRSIVLQDMTIRRIEIMGEAVKNLPYDLRNEHPEVPWRDIAGLKDIVIHQYTRRDKTVNTISAQTSQSYPAMSSPFRTAEGDAPEGSLSRPRDDRLAPL